MDGFGAANLRQLARGATALVYEWGEGRVLKLFNAGYPRGAALREYRSARIVADLGVPSARAYEFREENGRYAIVYERVDGGSVLDALMAGGDFRAIVEGFVGLHKRFLSARTQDAPPIKDMWMESAVRGGAGEWAKLIELLPDGDRLCHGDYHPGNVILAPDGPRAIDFMNVCRGDAAVDVARTLYLIEYPPADAPPELRRMLADLYLAGMGVARADAELLLPAVMAARLGEGVPAIEREMLLTELSKVRFC